MIRTAAFFVGTASKIGSERLLIGHIFSRNERTQLLSYEMAVSIIEYRMRAIHKFILKSPAQGHIPLRNMVEFQERADTPFMQKNTFYAGGLR